MNTGASALSYFGRLTIIELLVKLKLTVAGIGP